MSQSPEGWVETPLDTVVSSSVGGMWGSPTPNGGDVPVRVIRGAEFRDWSTTRAASAPRRFIPAAALASRQLKLGDIVLEVSGGGPTQPVGRTVLIDEEALKSAEDALICSNFCRRIVLSRELNPWFVWYQLLHGYSRGNTDAFQRATTNIRNLQVPRYLAGTYLVVPPLAEQARIVGAVDELLHSVNAGVSTLQKVRRNLVRMRASVLQSAITGILFGDDRPISGPAGLPQSWRMVTVADVAEVSGGITKNPRRKPRNNPIPFLRVANVPRDSLDLSEIHEIEVYDGELERLRLKSGDLLVVEGNGSPDQIGRSALWHGEIDPCVHQNHLIRVRPGAEILPDYLNLYWNAPSSMALIQAAATSTSGLHTLSTGKVRSVPVSLPPISTQARIVAEVKRQLSYADRLASDVAAVDGRASRLRTAVLSAAFAGLLFPRTSATSMR